MCWCTCVHLNCSTNTKNVHEKKKCRTPKTLKCYSDHVESINQFASRFNLALEAALRCEIDRIHACSSDESVFHTYEHLITLANAGGKRARPFVASLLFQACQGTTDASITPTLVALETFHLFALVHDDVMDNAEERHGKPTMHAAVRIRLAQSGATGDTRSTAMAEAILAGDLLLSLVHQFLLKQLDSDIPQDRVRRAHELLIQMSREVVIGQHLDVEFTTRRDVREREILDRHHLKTSLYTFVRPMQIGAILGGGGTEILEFCEAFGSALGLGFQLEDDLLDLLADEATLGKMPGADLTQRQHTLLTAKVRQRGTAEDGAMLESFWGHVLSPSKLHSARQMFHESGAIESVRERAKATFNEARATLQSSPLPKDANLALESLLTFFEARLP